MFSIVPLTRDHNRTEFDCGVAALNTFLRGTARRHGEKGISRTFVLTENDKPTTILGFFTLSLCEVIAEQLPRTYAGKYPKHGLPAIRLARPAVSLRHQGKGYGGLLLAEAVHRTVFITEHAGGVGLFVDAKDDRAQSFYQRYGFVPLPGRHKRLFLPLETLRAASIP